MDKFAFAKINLVKVEMKLKQYYEIEHEIKSNTCRYVKLSTSLLNNRKLKALPTCICQTLNIKQQN